MSVLSSSTEGPARRNSSPAAEVRPDQHRAVDARRGHQALPKAAVKLLVGTAVRERVGGAVERGPVQGTPVVPELQHLVVHATGIASAELDQDVLDQTPVVLGRV